MKTRLYSEEQRELRGEVTDVYTYDSLPRELRVQIVHIWSDTLGSRSDYYSHYHGENVRQAYGFIVKSLCREYGLFRLPPTADYEDEMYLEELTNYLLSIDNLEKQLDVVQLSFQRIDKVTRKHNYLRRGLSDKLADNAISELNLRFREHERGFQFVEGRIIRVDSELIHSEVVIPTLRLLNERDYAGAQQEFLNAYEHYRHGRYEEAISDCLKSFESVMKAICDKRKWAYQPNATASALIGICFDNNLVPQYLRQHYNSLRSTLESGIPPIRNREAAHGQGATPTEVPEHLVAYMLNMTASALLFLTMAEKNPG